MARILVLDTDVSLVAQTLLGADHEVYCTRNPDAAVQIAKESRPQIPLTVVTKGTPRGVTSCAA